MIRTARPADAAAIADIYNHYVRETVITFEETPVSAEEMARRIADIGARYPWLVYEYDGAVVGWAYATEWKTRSAYRFSVETTVYLADSHRGRGTAQQSRHPDFVARFRAGAQDRLGRSSNGDDIQHELLAARRVTAEQRGTCMLGCGHYA